MKNTLAIIGIILLVVLGAFLGWWLRGFKPVIIDPVVQTDTIWLHDTVHVIKPVHRIVRVTDTMLVPVVDTVHTRDSVFISIPREEKVYEDSTYRAVVSGYRPSLDSISIFQQTAIVEKVVYQKVKKHWGFGVNAGWGVMVDPFGGKATLHTGPTISFGVNYSF